MGLRELLILLLGFAIVAVILRGLYVAMQARRGQIKLAIDKNIPQDVDLDALEMAELPGGGARVVDRASGEDLAEKTALETAKERAADMDLGEDDSAVPVLMDSVAVASANESANEPGFVESTEQYEDPDDVLLDYGEEDEENEEGKAEFAVEGAGGLDSVRPDYPQEQADDYQEEQGELAFADSDEPTVSGERIEPSFGDAFQQDEKADSFEEQEESYRDDFINELNSYGGSENTHEETVLEGARNNDSENLIDDDFPGEGDADRYVGPNEQEHAYGEYEDGLDEAEQYDDELYEDDQDEDDQYEDEFVAAEPDSGERIDPEADDQARAEPSFDPDAVLDDADSFSMTAGERIGYQEEPSNAGRSLFSRFSSNDSAEEFEPGEEEEAPQKRESLLSTIRKKVVDTSLERFKSEPTDTTDSAADLIEEQGPEELEDFFEDEPVQLDIEQESGLEEELEQPAAAELRPTSSGQPTEIRQQNTSAQPSEVVVLNVMAKEGYAFHGEDLMQLLITSGLKFGEMAIFHKRLGNDSSGPVIFSVANVLNPGTFNLNDMANFSTVGISMFLALPSPINNLEAFDMMLGTAQRLCEVLDGDLKDDHRNVMTAQTIEHYRQRIRDFELRQLKAAGSRG